MIVCNYLSAMKASATPAEINYFMESVGYDIERNKNVTQSNAVFGVFNGYILPSQKRLPKPLYLFDKLCSIA